jgi:hypothetical protein
MREADRHSALVILIECEVDLFSHARLVEGGLQDCLKEQFQPGHIKSSS